LRNSASIGFYLLRHNHLDESLLKRRNKIAHGEFLDVTAEEWRELADEIIMMLRHFKTDLENAASLEIYKIAA
jgi:MAE_28990/MAE_18760-like HEPN